jgi:hypothetical protein
VSDQFSATARLPLLRSLPPGLTPVPAGESSSDSRNRTVRTAEQFRLATAKWYGSQLGSFTTEEASAVHKYLSLTLALVLEVGIIQGLRYHMECVEAAQCVPALYCPLINGPKYVSAYEDHIRRFLKSNRTAAPRVQTSSKRKAKAEGGCTVHGPSANHTDAQCFQQKDKASPPSASAKSKHKRQKKQRDAEDE